MNFTARPFSRPGPGNYSLNSQCSYKSLSCLINSCFPGPYGSDQFLLCLGYSAAARMSLKSCLANWVFCLMDVTVFSEIFKMASLTRSGSCSWVFFPYSFRMENTLAQTSGSGNNRFNFLTRTCFSLYSFICLGIWPFGLKAGSFQGR